LYKSAFSENPLAWHSPGNLIVKSNRLLNVAKVKKLSTQDEDRGESNMMFDMERAFFSSEQYQRSDID